MTLPRIHLNVPECMLMVFAATICLSGCQRQSDEPPAMDWQTVRSRDMDGVVRQNMRAVQVAAEHFAADHGSNSYPMRIDDAFKSYMPGGNEGQTPSPIGPVNPFSGHNEFPELGLIGDISQTRNGQRFNIAAGSIRYAPLSSGKGYAIVGGAHDGKALMDIYHPNQILVLTNVVVN